MSNGFLHLEDATESDWIVFKTSPVHVSEENAIDSIRVFLALPSQFDVFDYNMCLITCRGGQSLTISQYNTVGWYIFSRIENASIFQWNLVRKETLR